MLNYYNKTKSELWHNIMYLQFILKQNSLISTYGLSKTDRVCLMKELQCYRLFIESYYNHKTAHTFFRFELFIFLYFFFSYFAD